MQLHPYSIYMFVSASISAAIGAIAWRRRNAPGARMMAISMLALTVWSLCYGFVWMNTALARQIFWMNVMYFGVVVIPLSFLVLVLQVTQREQWLTRQRFLLLCVEPVLMLIIIWTDKYHHLFRTSAIDYVIGHLTYLHWIRGPLYWFNVVYSYSLLLACVILLARTFLRGSPLYRSQIGALLVGACIPWIGNFLSIMRLLPLRELDVTPIAFGISGITFYYALFYQRMFDLLPVARSLLIEHISDGLMVVDKNFRILDINPAGEKLLDVKEHDVIGKDGLRLFPDWKDISELLTDSDQEMQGEIPGRTNRSRYYDLKITPLKNKRTTSGYLILFRDISDRWKAEHSLRMANQELKTRIKEVERLQKKLRQQNVRDPMTDLYNRRFLEEALESEIARAERASHQVVIIMMDADDFKKINDHNGHKAGDLALQSLAKLIQLHIRRSDIGCRYGGEEFVVVMPNTTVETAYERAEHIRLDYLNLKLLGPNSHRQASISIGIASYPADGSNGEDVLNAADQAMYAAKASGGNRTKIHRKQTKKKTAAKRKSSAKSSSSSNRPRRSRSTKSR